MAYASPVDIAANSQPTDTLYLIYLRCLMAFMGGCEASLGPNLPSIQHAYALSTAEVSILVLPHALGFVGLPFCGSHFILITLARCSEVWPSAL